MKIPLFATILISKDKVLGVDIPLYLTSDYLHSAVVSDSFFNDWFGNFDNPVLRHVPVSEISPFIQSAISTILSQNPTVSFLVGDDLTGEAYDITSLEFTESYQLTFSYRSGWVTPHYSASASFQVGVDIEPDDLYTDLYLELLDNEETKLSLQRWIDDDSTWDSYTDKDIEAMKLIEKYNKNVLLLRSTRKVKANVNGSISTSSNSSVNLSGVESKLQNINNNLTSLNDKLEVEEQIDGDTEIKSLTQVVKDLDLSNQTVITTVEKPPYNPLLDDGEIF